VKVVKAPRLYHHYPDNRKRKRNPRFNHKILAIRRKIISKTLELVNYHWVDKLNNLPKVYCFITDRTNMLDVISNDSPWTALDQLRAERKPKISDIPEAILKSRDPRIYLKRKLLPLPQEEKAIDMDISTTPPTSPVEIILDSPPPSPKGAFKVVTLDN